MGMDRVAMDIRALKIFKTQDWDYYKSNVVGGVIFYRKCKFYL